MLSILALLALAAPAPAPQGYAGRIAVVHDGNIHDKDDIGAAAMSLAICYQSATLQLVHFQVSNHLDMTVASQQADMATTAAGANSVYGFPSSIVFDAYATPLAASQHLASEINLTSFTNPLVIVIAGPWESMAQAFDLATPSTHEFVYIVTHSAWNDDHPHPTSNWPNHGPIAFHRNRTEFLDQYQAGGKWSTYRAPHVISIVDQNAYWATSLNSWFWLNGHTPETTFVHQRTSAAGYAQGDMSDAGMVFYCATGNATPTMQEIEAFFNYP